MPTDEAFLAYEKVFDFASVNLALRDSVDAGIVANVRTQTGTLINAPVRRHPIRFRFTSTWIRTVSRISGKSHSDIRPMFPPTTIPQPISSTLVEEYDNWLAGLTR